MGGIHCVGSETLADIEHREKHVPREPPLFNTLVVRIIPAGTPEFKSSGCQTALRSERERLEKQREEQRILLNAS